MRWSTLILFGLACTAKQGAEGPLQAAPSPVAAPAPDPLEIAAQARADAITAYQAKDFETFLARSEAGVAADPDSVVNRYNVACAHALLGHRDEALQALRWLRDQGVDFGAAQDPDFASLKDDEGFQALVAEFAALFPRVAHAERAFDLGDAVDIAPEGIAYDAATGRYFVGSMRHGTIYERRADGTVRTLGPLMIDQIPVAALGLEVDAARHRLWAVGTAFDVHKDYVPAHRGTSAVFGLDLTSGEIVEVHAVHGAAGFGFNDLTVGADGAIYLSGEDVYVLRPGADVPVRLGVQPPIVNSNGITVGTDPHVLYVAADQRGIARVDLTTLKRRWLTLPAGVNLRSFDGLYQVDGALVGIQLGLGHWRVVRADLDATGTQVVGIEVLEQSNPQVDFTTTGAVVGDDLVVITHAPLAEGADAKGAGGDAGQTVAWRVPIRP